MAEKNKKSFQIKTNYYLCGPLALCAFFLMDVIGGFNFPGYIWGENVTGDLVALNSHSLIISLIFAIIYAVLTVFSAYCLFKYFKKTKINKTFNKGLKMILIAIVVFALGFCIFLQPEYGTYEKVKEYAQIEIKEEPMTLNEGTEDAIEGTTTVFDQEAMAENMENLTDLLTENPTVIGGLATSLVANILAIVGLIIMLIGGFKKGGKILFAALAVFCLVLIAYSCFAVAMMIPDILGLNSRFSNYAMCLFMAFMSGYVYVTNIEE